jgi:hypothetical protein
MVRETPAMAPGLEDALVGAVLGALAVLAVLGVSASEATVLEVELGLAGVQAGAGLKAGADLAEDLEHASDSSLNREGPALAMAWMAGSCCCARRVHASGREAMWPRTRGCSAASAADQRSEAWVKHLGVGGATVGGQGGEEWQRTSRRCQKCVQGVTYGGVPQEYATLQ